MFGTEFVAFGGICCGMNRFHKSIPVVDVESFPEATSSYKGMNKHLIKSFYMPVRYTTKANRRHQISITNALNPCYVQWNPVTHVSFVIFLNERKYRLSCKMNWKNILSNLVFWSNTTGDNLLRWLKVVIFITCISNYMLSNAFTIWNWVLSHSSQKSTTLVANSTAFYSVRPGASFTDIA